MQSHVSKHSRVLLKIRVWKRLNWLLIWGIYSVTFLGTTFHFKRIPSKGQEFRQGGKN